jgi:signal transduction histidine kinase
MAFTCPVGVTDGLSAALPWVAWPGDPGDVVWLPSSVGPTAEAEVLAAGRIALIAGPSEAAWRAVAEGGVDACAADASDAEVEARLRGLEARGRRWTPIAARLSTALAHDLRSPLQGMRFTLSALEGEGVFGTENAEDLQMLLAVADTLEVILHGIYNLGRTLSPARGEPVDLATLLREEAARPFFGGRVVFDGDTGTRPTWIRGNAADVRQAVLDLLRVALQLSPGGKKIRADLREVGDEAVLVIHGQTFPAVREHLAHLEDRAFPLQQRGKVRLPLAGLGFAGDVARSHGGGLTLQLEAPDVVVWHWHVPLSAGG